MTITDTAKSAAVITIPAGARIPIGNPPRWLAAAIAADWQCQCATPGKGQAKDACGRTHWDDQDHRCQHKAAGTCAMRLVLAPDASGATRLLCETCATGHASTATRKKAEQLAPPPADFEQDFLFDLPEAETDAAR